MPISNLSGLLGFHFGPLLRLSTSQNPNLHSLFGAPTLAFRGTVLVPLGVSITSADPNVPALDFGPFPAGSYIVLVVDGEIRGAGGKGGNGRYRFQSFLGEDHYGGGGGGGAGTVIGAKGIGAFSPTNDGAPGSASAGGIGAATEVFASALDKGSNVQGFPGQDGGDAIYVTTQAAIKLGSSALIWSGGGGGAGATFSLGAVSPPYTVPIAAAGFSGAGGAPGEQGESVEEFGPVAGPSGFVTAGGLGGFAIRYNGNSVNLIDAGANIMGQVA